MSISNDIKLGDTVRLASGGQKMTVGSIPSKADGFATCYWFRDHLKTEKYGDFESAQIPLGALVKVKNDTSIEDF